MGYYMGAGDYYRGDGNYAAGGFFSGIGKAIGKVAKIGVNLLPGPVGAVARTIVNNMGPSAAPAQLAPFPMMNTTMFSGAAPGGARPRPGVTGAVQRFLPGGETGYIKRRRINPLNIKALRRAMRRAKGFEKQARRVGSFFNPGKSFRLKGRKRRAK